MYVCVQPRSTLVCIPARAATSALLAAQTDQKMALLAYITICKKQQYKLCPIKGFLIQIEGLFLNITGNLRR